MHVLLHDMDESTLLSSSFLLPGSSIWIPNPSSEHHNLASQTLFLDTSTSAVPRMYSFLILSLLITLTEDLSIFSSATSCPPAILDPLSPLPSHYKLVNLPVQSCCYPTVTNYPWRSSPLTPPCLCSLLHLFCTVCRFVWLTASISIMPPFILL